MKLLRWGAPVHEKPGGLGSDGQRRDVPMLLDDIGPAQLSPRTLAALALLGCGSIAAGALGRALRHSVQRDRQDRLRRAQLCRPCSRGRLAPAAQAGLDKGKGCDTFAPLGPWLVTSDKIANPQDLSLWLELNGQRVQNSSTCQWAFSIAALGSYISRFMSLQPGDVISTGTPPGVGLGQKLEPWFLKTGDRMSLGIQGLGLQEQRGVAAHALHKPQA